MSIADVFNEFVDLVVHTAGQFAQFPISNAGSDLNSIRLTPHITTQCHPIKVSEVVLVVKAKGSQQSIVGSPEVLTSPDMHFAW